MLPLIKTQISRNSYLFMTRRTNGQSKSTSNIFHKIDGVPEKPHVHKGYEHNENGDFKLSETERKMVDSIMKTWYNNLGK